MNSNVPKGKSEKRTEVVGLKDITLSYDDQKKVLDRCVLPLRLRDGERPLRYALIGKSGSGKTSIVDLLLGKIVPQRGSVFFNGSILQHDEKSLRIHRSSIGYVSQRLNGTIGYLSLFENVARPALLKGYSSVEAFETAEIALQSVNLNKRLWKRKPDQLSGGELQRALLAKTIVQKPRFLICDEPTSALDRPNSQLVVEAIVETKIPTLIVTHDPALIAPRMDSLFLLRQGKCVDITALKNDPVLRNFRSDDELFKASQFVENEFKRGETISDAIPRVVYNQTASRSQKNGRNAATSNRI